MSIEIVQAVRAKYPTPLGVAHGAFLLEVAAALNLGLLKKSGGTFITLPDGTKVSQDCVMKPNGIHWDVLKDGEGAALPRFDLVANPDGSPFLTDIRNYYPVVAVPQPGPTPEPTPVPVPTPAPPATCVCDLAPVLARLDAIEREVAQLNESLSRNLEAIDVDLGNINGNLVNLTNKPAPSYTGRIFGVNVVLRPV